MSARSFTRFVVHVGALEVAGVVAIRAGGLLWRGTAGVTRVTVSFGLGFGGAARFGALRFGACVT
jgi:hypothetical protein